MQVSPAALQVRWSADVTAACSWVHTASRACSSVLLASVKPDEHSSGQIRPCLQVLQSQLAADEPKAVSALGGRHHIQQPGHSCQALGKVASARWQVFTLQPLKRQTLCLGLSALVLMSGD